MNQIVPLAPAPWKLRGRGWLFLYHMPKEVARIPELLPKESTGSYLGGLSALMLVDYESSNVGPYKELLFIPGRFRWQDEKYYGISRIWVSTEASVVNGQNNWGIPKELADFQSTQENRNESWTIKRDGKVFFQAKLSKGRVPFPMHTSLLPLPLLQRWKGQFFQTNFKGRGWARLARLDHLEVKSDVFPEITAYKPLFGMAIEPFRIEFPLPRMLSADIPWPEPRVMQPIP